MDLVGALQNPQYDPRSENHGPVFRRKMRELADLKPGMWIKGTVRNVVDFGAFVDVGLKEEGLIHISQFSRRYVRNPLKFLHVGDMVDVRIVAIEADKHRISLTLIPEKPDRHRTPPAGRKPSEGAAARAARPAGRTPAAGTARAAPRPGDGQAPAPPRSADRRAPAGAGRGDRPAGRSDRSRDARSDRPPRGRSERRPRTGPPRIIVSKAKTDAVDRPPDDMGRPRLRWAYYESDPQEDLYGNTDLEQEPPAAESPETPAPEDVSPQPEAPAPQDEAPPPEAPQAPESEPPAAQAAAAPTPEPQGPPDQPQ
jgi:predicted RNA-binding protein with RPS1 domain